MTEELAKNRMDYWGRKLNLYDFPEFCAAAQNNFKLASAMKRLGYKIPKQKIQLQKTVYIKASDDWYPCYRDNMVAVSFRNGRISVCGADDFYMSLKDASEEIYEKIINSTTSKDSLKKMGFVECD